jgi:hypothetical protein
VFSVSQEIKAVRCATFESRINDLLDARQDPSDDATLVRHAESCASCKAVFADYLALDDSLSNIVWDAETLARLAAPTSVARPNTLWWSAVLAATLLIGIGVFFRAPSRHDNASATNPTPIAMQQKHSAELGGHPFDQKPDQIPGTESLAQTSPTGPPLTPVSWNELSERLQPVLNPYYQISAELPGIRPIQSSLYITIDWVQAKILKHASQQPKHGFGRCVRLSHPLA